MFKTWVTPTFCSKMASCAHSRFPIRMCLVTWPYFSVLLLIFRVILSAALPRIRRSFDSSISSSSVLKLNEWVGERDCAEVCTRALAPSGCFRDPGDLACGEGFDGSP